MNLQIKPIKPTILHKYTYLKLQNNLLHQFIKQSNKYLPHTTIISKLTIKKNHNIPKTFNYIITYPQKTQSHNQHQLTQLNKTKILKLKIFTYQNTKLKQL